MEKFLVILLCLLFLTSCAVDPEGKTKEIEEVVDDNYHIVDTHVHFQASTNIKDYGEHADAMLVAMEDYQVETSLVTIVLDPENGEKFDHSPLIEAIDSSSSLMWLGGYDIITPYVEMEEEDITSEVLVDFESDVQGLIDEGVDGFGELIIEHFCMTDWHNYQSYDANHPIYLALADISAENNIPMDFHMEAVEQTTEFPKNLKAACDKNPNTVEATIPEFEELLDHNKDAIIIWNHVGWDNSGEQSIDLFDRLLSEHQNLYLSFRYIDTQNPYAQEALVIDPDTGEAREEWIELIREYPDRFMVDSDDFFNSDGPGAFGEDTSAYASTFEMLELLPSDIRSQVAYKNAERVYGI